jgi:hypothetical protein
MPVLDLLIEAGDSNELCTCSRFSFFLLLMPTESDAYSLGTQSERARHERTLVDARAHTDTITALCLLDGRRFVSGLSCIELAP